MKEAAEERVAPVGAAGVRGPREREDCLLMSLRLLRGALGGRDTSLLWSCCALKFCWFLLQKVHGVSILGNIMIILFVAIITDKDANVCCPSYPKNKETKQKTTRHSWLHSLGSLIPTLCCI